MKVLKTLLLTKNSFICWKRIPFHAKKIDRIGQLNSSLKDINMHFYLQWCLILYILIFSNLWKYFQELQSSVAELEVKCQHHLSDKRELRANLSEIQKTNSDLQVWFVQYRSYFCFNKMSLFTAKLIRND